MQISTCAHSEHPAESVLSAPFARGENWTSELHPEHKPPQREAPTRAGRPNVGTADTGAGSFFAGRAALGIGGCRSASLASNLIENHCPSIEARGVGTVFVCSVLSPARDRSLA